MVKRRNIYTKEIREKARKLRIEDKTFADIDRLLGNLPRGTSRRWFQAGTNELKEFYNKDKSKQIIGLLHIDSIIKWDELPQRWKEKFNQNRVKKRKGRRYSNQIIDIYKCTCSACKRNSYKTWDALYLIKKKLETKVSTFRGCNWCDLGEGPIDYLNEPYNKKVSAWKVKKWRKVENTMPSVKSETSIEWFCLCTICNKTERWIKASQLNSIIHGRENKTIQGTGCGCNTRPLRDYYRQYGRQHMEWFYDLRRRAKKERLLFDLDPSDIYDIPKTCPILGIKLVAATGKPTDNSPSVDKFFPELGYTKNNIHIISYRANRIKNDGTPSEWKRIVKWGEKTEVKMKLEGKHPDQKRL